jgi:stage II sporulation protein D
LLITAFCLAGRSAAANIDFDEPIRVGLKYGSTALTSVTINGIGKGEGERSRGDFDGELTVRADGDSLILEHKGRRADVGRWVEFWSTDRQPWLDFDEATYRGKLRVELQGHDRVKVVNILELEDYLRGVVPNEMFANGEASKVQAVISRTFALYARDVERKHRRDGFDICTTGHCQVYHGLDSERPLADRAIKATRGEVITHRRRPIFSAYHANAGGLTQTVDEAWPGSVRENFPYLASVPSPYDAKADELRGYQWCYRWQRTIPAREVAERLRARGSDVGEVTDLVVREKTSTGRVKVLEVRGSKRSVKLKRPSEVRAALQLPSVRCEITKGPEGFEVVGWGRGHGVGLSQHGALGMAKSGFTYDQILGHFYRGVSLTSEYGRGPARDLPPPDLKIETTEASPVTVPPGVS